MSYSQADLVGHVPAFPKWLDCGTRPTVTEASHLQLAIRRAISESGKTRDHFDRLLQEKTGTKGKPIYDIDRGKSKNPSLETIEAIAAVFGKPLSYFRSDAGRVEQPEDDPIPMVGIQHIDLSWGLGATFTDGPVEVEVLQFPRVWVETITASPPALLTWSRGRGDSMAPTIHDGDLVLLDRSQRRVQEQDALWAFTIGDVGAIKRLRVKGDRFQILSDNPSVPPDEEPIDFVNIVARVVFVGKRT